MKLIAGLGNPGDKYMYNRHNVGFMVVDALARTNSKSQILKFSNNIKFDSQLIQEKDFILLKPQTYMNDSGVAIAKICQFYKIKNEDLYIVHDDLDIKLGSYKIQYGKGPQVHNGLLSIEEKLGTDQFWNVRVGVENRPVRGNKGIPGMVYSLQDFDVNERAIVDEVIEQIVADLGRVVSL